MAKKLEVVQNGNFSNGDPVYQIGSTNADGELEIAVFELMTETEAKAKLKSMGGSSSAKKKEVVEEVEEIKAQRQGQQAQQAEILQAMNEAKVAKDAAPMVQTLNDTTDKQ